MKWIILYLRTLLTWSFTQWRIHQAIVAILVAVIVLIGKFIGMSWLNTLSQVIVAYFVIWLVILTFFVAPACLWHQMDEKLRLSDQSRPWVIIDGYEGYYSEDDQTGQEYLVETLHIVNRGDTPAVSIAIPPVKLLGRTARLINPLPTLGPGESAEPGILNLRRVLEEVNKKVPKVRGQPWSVRIPLSIEYRDLSHRRWVTDHAITFNVMGISIGIVHPNEPQEWTDVSVIQ
jgi:hypothetical protein